MSPREQWAAMGYPMISRMRVTPEERLRWVSYLLPWRSPDGVGHPTQEMAQANCHWWDEGDHGKTEVEYTGTDEAPASGLPPFEPEPEPLQATVCCRGGLRL